MPDHSLAAVQDDLGPAVFLRKRRLSHSRRLHSYLYFCLRQVHACLPSHAESAIKTAHISWRVFGLPARNPPLACRSTTHIRSHACLHDAILDAHGAGPKALPSERAAVPAPAAGRVAPWRPGDEGSGALARGEAVAVAKPIRAPVEPQTWPTDPEVAATVAAPAVSSKGSASGKPKTTTAPMPAARTVWRPGQRLRHRRPIVQPRPTNFVGPVMGRKKSGRAKLLYL